MNMSSKAEEEADDQSVCTNCGIAEIDYNSVRMYFRVLPLLSTCIIASSILEDCVDESAAS